MKTNLDAVDEWIHGEVLQENIRTLEQDVDLSHGFIMDEMLQIGILTDNDNYEKKRDQKDKIIGNNFSPEKQGKFQEFFSLVAKEEFYPHIL